MMFSLREEFFLGVPMSQEQKRPGKYLLRHLIPTKAEQEPIITPDGVYSDLGKGVAGETVNTYGVGGR